MVDPAPEAAELARSFGMFLDHESGETNAGAPSPDSSTVEEPETAGPKTIHDAPAPPPLSRILEAMLFVGGPPLTAARACETVRGLTEEQFDQSLDALERDYRRQGRPYAVLARERGYVLGLRPRFQSVVEKLFGGPRETRLSPAAIDVLALVAYRQPVAKQEIDAIRGIDSGAILRQLVRRGLAEVTHRGEAGQREVSYGTTKQFLELFGLHSLDDLPQTQDLQKL